MPVIAAIDIGTNSVKMTVAQTEGRHFTILQSESNTTRLGKDVDRTGRLSEQGMAATLEELKRLKAIVDDRQVTAVAVVGTSALRDAANGSDFLHAVKSATGFEVEIVSGDREAELAYRAVATDPTMRLVADKPLVVFDLGGGSTELVYGRDNRIVAHKSVNIGAVRITERCLKTDPPTQDEIELAADLAKSLIASAGIPVAAHGAQVAALGGTLVNLSAIRSSGIGDPHGSKVSAQDVDAILVRLRAVPLAERKLIPGIDPARADVLIGGAIIAAAVLASVAATSFTVSKRGLRYGLLSELAER